MFWRIQKFIYGQNPQDCLLVQDKGYIYKYRYLSKLYLSLVMMLRASSPTHSFRSSWLIRYSPFSVSFIFFFSLLTKSSAISGFTMVKLSFITYWEHAIGSKSEHLNRSQWKLFPFKLKVVKLSTGMPLILSNINWFSNWRI